MIVNTRKHSYLINREDLATVELGSFIYDAEANKVYSLLAPNTLTEIGTGATAIADATALIEAVAAGGNFIIAQAIDAPTAFTVTADSTITNDSVISISEDTVGDGVFKATAGTLTLNGKGTINGIGNNNWNMALWATEDGKIVINDGYFTNEGATATVDPEHFDLIYASGNGQIEINGGEFKCQTPAWTLNIKDKDRATASIIVKGGKFHGFNPADCKSEGEHTNFVAPGYKVIEENGIFTVIAE